MRWTMPLDLVECALCNLPVAVFLGPSVKQPAVGSDGQLHRTAHCCGAMGRRDMALRDNAQRPDIGALVAMVGELVATSHELTARARNVVERARHLRVQVQARSQRCACPGVPRLSTVPRLPPKTRAKV
jgi:hypothetical protein